MKYKQSLLNLVFAMLCFSVKNAQELIKAFGGETAGRDGLSYFSVGQTYYTHHLCGKVLIMVTNSYLNH